MPTGLGQELQISWRLRVPLYSAARVLPEVSAEIASVHPGWTPWLRARLSECSRYTVNRSLLFMEMK
jgi:hypothetical protein